MEPETNGRQFRSGTAADESSLCALWLASWDLTYPDIDFEARLPWFRDWLRGALASGTRIVVADAGGEMAGFVGIAADGLIEQFAVAPTRWRTGIGGALIAEAKRLSPEGLRLAVNADNARALAFYRRHGFAVAGTGVNPNSRRATLVMRWP